MQLRTDNPQIWRSIQGWIGCKGREEEVKGSGHEQKSNNLIESWKAVLVVSPRLPILIWMWKALVRSGGRMPTIEMRRRKLKSGRKCREFLEIGVGEIPNAATKMWRAGSGAITRLA